MQQSLNRLLGLRLAVDGVAGAQTHSAVRSFQGRNGLTADGIVGPRTEAALVRAGAGPPPGSEAGDGGLWSAVAGGISSAPSSAYDTAAGAFSPLYSSAFPGTRGGARHAAGAPPVTLVNVSGIGKTSGAFRDKVVRIAQDIGTDPNFLMAIMSFESSLDPKAVNKYSDATGLIQFMPKTAERLGTSTDALMLMSAEQQLDYVWKYFAPYKGTLRTLEDAYMAVLYPSAIGRGGAHVLFSSPSTAYQQNSVLDVNHDGHITVAEAASLVRKRLPAGYPTAWGGTSYAGTSPPAATTPAPPPSGVATAGVNTPLPFAGPGFYSYTTADKRFGLSKTIQAVLAVGAEWEKAHPAGPLLGVGDISRQGGGPFPPHGSHQKGVDVDVRPVRNDGRNEPTTYQSPTYSRALTQHLVDIVRANKVLTVRTILFNDPNVRGVSPWAGHDNHLHVSFNAPT